MVSFFPGSMDDYFRMCREENAREVRERRISAVKCPHDVPINRAPCPQGGEECDQYMTQD